MQINGKGYITICLGYAVYSLAFVYPRQELFLEH